jgi:ankyrin repeat protein
LKNGAKRSINVKNNIGQTPLHIATENGSGEIVKLLLENGANYTIRDFKDQDDLYLFS